MTPNDEHQPVPVVTREEIAWIEVGHTTIDRATARLLVAAFLLAIVCLPLAELALAPPTPDGPSTTTPWAILAGVPADVSRRLEQMSPAVQTSVWARTVTGNRAVLEDLSAFEVALEDGSQIGGRLRPPAQMAMSRWLGAGNERVYPGREGWLFYRPDVEFVSGRGFLEAAQLARRAARISEWASPIQPDPRRAIVHLKRDLDARGITLIVMPTPVKPTIHPERLSGRYSDRNEPLQNASYTAFVADLEREGIHVLDVSALLADAKSAAPQYLATDTHWRPEAMELAAEALGGMVAANVRLAPVPNPGLRVERVQLRASGDTARMLDLRDGQTLYPEETVWLRRVTGADGTPWRPVRDADVLVLGDSFSNIYSLASMGWGDAAGLVEHLSRVLRRPVDRIVQNDQGAFATRAMLRQAVQDGTDRLAGKRVVIYQFAARELAFGDWQVIELPRADDATSLR